MSSSTSSQSTSGRSTHSPTHPRWCGLTQLELAERAGVVRPLISQYETGKKDPSVSMLARLLDACGMELRMEASAVTDADRDQYRHDREVGPEQARRNALRASREVVSVRRFRG